MMNTWIITQILKFQKNIEFEMHAPDFYLDDKRIPVV